MVDLKKKKCLDKAGNQTLAGWEILQKAPMEYCKRWVKPPPIPLLIQGGGVAHSLKISLQQSIRRTDRRAKTLSFIRFVPAGIQF